jgi:hypothetical protein
VPADEFVVAGDSHIFAMGARQDYAGPLSLAPIESTGGHGHFLMEQWLGGRGEHYWDGLVQHSNNRTVVLVVMGNQHFAYFLLARKPLFDFVDPWDPGHALYPGSVVVPRRMVKALPMVRTGWERDLIRRLRVGGCRDIIVIGTPPVIEDLEGAHKFITEYPFWRERAASMGMDIATCGLTPAPIMKRLWGVLQESLANLAHETGIRFLSVPNETIDKSGYRKAEYCGPSWSFAHANEEYGRLMLERIMSAVGDGARESLSPAARSHLDVA